jgi:hypothetical protein
MYKVKVIKISERISLHVTSVMLLIHLNIMPCIRELAPCHHGMA